MNNKVINVNDFHPTTMNIKVDKGDRNSFGLAMYKLSYNDMSPIIIEIPSMETPFGLNDNQYGKSLYVNFDMNNEIHNKFYNGMIDLEKIIIENIYNYRVILCLAGSKTMSEKISLNDVKEKFKPLVVKNNYGVGLNLKIEVNAKTKETITTFIDENNNSLDINKENITKKCKMDLTLKISSIYINKDNDFGVSIKLSKIKLLTKSIKPFEDKDKNEEDENEEEDGNKNLNMSDKFLF